MPPTNESRPELELDDFIRAYEAEIADETIDLAKFLPPIDHPLYGLVLRELVRIDLERRWSRGRPRPLEEYQTFVPRIVRRSRELECRSRSRSTGFVARRARKRPRPSMSSVSAST